MRRRIVIKNHSTDINNTTQIKIIIHDEDSQSCDAADDKAIWSGRRKSAAIVDLSENV